MPETLVVTAPSSSTFTEQWTPDKIYKQAVLQEYRLCPPRLSWWALCPQSIADVVLKARYQEEFLAIIRGESSWIREEDLPSIEIDLQEAVGCRKIRCPCCSGTKDIYLLHIGRDTGIQVRLPKDCLCLVYIAFWSVWDNPVQVPKRFRHSGAAGIVEPVSSIMLSFGRQEQIISTLSEDPQRSYFLFGPPNTGKTYMLTVLYRQALQLWATQRYETRAC
jgi:hypothetical protein